MSTAVAVLVAAAALQPGAITSLNGTWEYQPASAGKSYSVPVPQMLNRIQWWLDDSEDFRAWENARLARLGFDTENDDDGTYRLELNVTALPKGRHLFVEFDGVAMLSKTWINGTGGASVRVPVSIAVPGRGLIRMALYTGNTLLSSSTEPIAIVAPAPVPDTSSFVRDLKSDWRKRAEAGETVVLLNPGKALVDLFPDDVESFRATVGEFAEALHALGFTGVLKWWGRKDDWRVFVASGAHRLKKGGQARELIRFIPPHSYIAPERVPEQYMAVVFDIPVGKGIVRVVDLDLDASVPVDPQARRIAAALLRQ